MINSSSDNVKKLNSINRRMFITGSLKFFVMIGIVRIFLPSKRKQEILTLQIKQNSRMEISTCKRRISRLFWKHNCWKF